MSWVDCAGAAPTNRNGRMRKPRVPARSVSFLGVTNSWMLFSVESMLLARTRWARSPSLRSGSRDGRRRWSLQKLLIELV